MAATDTHCEVISRTQLTPTVFELKLKPDSPIHFMPGQFASAVIPGAGPKGRDLRRAYSIASPPEREWIELVIKKVEGGPGTTYLSSLKAGDRMRIVAPYGEFVVKRERFPNLCVISTGTGIAPFRSLVQSKGFQESALESVRFLFGVQSQAERLYTTELQNGSRFEFLEAISRPTPGWTGFEGRVTDLLRSAKFEGYPWLESQFYMCGNSAMIDEVKIILAERGVPKDCVFQEVYYKG